MAKRLLALLVASVMLGFGASAPAQAESEWTRQAAPASAASQVLKGKPTHTARKMARSGLSALATCPCYHYAGGYQYPPTSGSPAALPTGASINMVIGHPFKNSTTYHTLYEMAVQSADGQQIIEVGVTVDQAVNGTLLPEVFVGSWVNDVFKGYNSGSGWTEYATYCNTAGAICAGDSALSWVGTNHQFQIRSSGGKWWVYIDGNPIGSFSQSSWTGATPSVTFDKFGLYQVFGEVVSPSATADCSDMGNGYTSSNASAARMGSAALLYAAGTGWNTTLPNLTAFSESDDGASPSVYPVTAISARTVAYGGPGTGGNRGVWNGSGWTGGC